MRGTTSRENSAQNKRESLRSSIRQKKGPAVGTPGQQSGPDKENVPRDGFTLLQEAYDKLHAKYTSLKARELSEATALFEEQRRRTAGFTQAAEAFIQELQTENLHLKKQIEESGVEAGQNRLRWLERAYIESQNDLVRERAQNVELQRHILDIESSATTALPMSDPDFIYPSQPPPCYTQADEGEAPPQEEAHPLGSQPHDLQSPTPNHCNGAIFGVQRDCSVDGDKGEQVDLEMQDISRFEQEVQHINAAVAEEALTERSLLQELLQQMTELSLVIDTKGRTRGESPKLIFTHPSTGFSFKLEHITEDDTWLELGSKGALEYEVLSLGTLVKCAPAWMRENIAFPLNQVQCFIWRLVDRAEGANS